MRDINKVLLIGRLGADPVSKETATGVPLTRFSVATSRGSRGLNSDTNDQELKTESSTIWHQVVAWGKEGEACARYLKRGAPVFVEGQIRQNRYVTPTGERRLQVEVHADRVSFLPSKMGTNWSELSDENREPSSVSSE